MTVHLPNVLLTDRPLATGECIHSDLQRVHNTHSVDWSGVVDFCRLKILNHQLAIPDFHGFTNDLVEGDTSGANADYIPILRCAADAGGSLLCVM